MKMLLSIMIALSCQLGRAENVIQDTSIYVIATKEAWLESKGQGAFIPASLKEEGFIHASTWSQLVPVLNTYYKGAKNLVVLELMTFYVSSPVEYEYVESWKQSFPHIYGPLKIEHVWKVHPISSRVDGTFAENVIAGLNKKFRCRPLSLSKDLAPEIFMSFSEDASLHSAQLVFGNQKTIYITPENSHYERTLERPDRHDLSSTLMTFWQTHKPLTHIIRYNDRDFRGYKLSPAQALSQHMLQKLEYQVYSSDFRGAWPSSGYACSGL